MNVSGLLLICVISANLWLILSQFRERVDPWNSSFKPSGVSRLMPFRQHSNFWKFSSKREPPRRKAVASASLFFTFL